jgi:hypothetical protein
MSLKLAKELLYSITLTWNSEQGKIVFTNINIEIWDNVINDTS